MNLSVAAHQLPALWGSVDSSPHPIPALPPAAKDPTAAYSPSGSVGQLPASQLDINEMQPVDWVSMVFGQPPLRLGHRDLLGCLLAPSWGSDTSQLQQGPRCCVPLSGMSVLLLAPTAIT